MQPFGLRTDCRLAKAQCHFGPERRLLTLRSTTGSTLREVSISAVRTDDIFEMIGAVLAQQSIRRRVAALTGTTMLVLLLVVPCAAMFAAVESDAHACCDHQDEHSSLPASDACERLCTSATSTLPPQSVTPDPGLAVVVGVDQDVTTLVPSARQLAVLQVAAPDPPPLFVLHCAFLI